MKTAKIFKATATKSSPTPKHVHANMFIAGEVYSVSKSNDPEWIRVSGKFKNSLGGFEHKEQSIQKSICKEFLEIIKCSHENTVLDQSGGDAESGPITFSHCVDCGKTFKQFGM